MGLNSYDYDGLQPKITAPKHFSCECTMEICNNCKITKQNPRGGGEFCKTLYQKTWKRKFVQEERQNLKKQQSISTYIA